MKKSNLKLSLLIALLLVVGGLAFIMYSRDRQTVVVTPPASKAQVAQAQAARPVTTTTAPAATSTSGEPVALSIPSLSINLSVVPGVYNASTGQWTLTSDKAQYAVVTPQPNTSGGNTFIYGHYRRGVFATLHTISMGSEAKVSTADGKTYVYKLVNVETVSPEESGKVFDYAPTAAPILTIQTCTGLLFHDRQLFTFDLERVS